MLCDGRDLLVSDYYFLFKVICYNYGSNTSNYFKLPNPAGRVLGVVGSGAGLTARGFGSNVGAETHTLTVAEMPTHNHTGTTNTSSTGITLNNSANVANTDSHNVRGVKDGIAADDSTCADGDNANLSITDPTHSHTFATSNTGLSNAHNNMQPTLFFGNMFVFSGIYGLGNFPYTTNTNIA
jgi:microcystin-dependent protein